MAELVQTLAPQRGGLRSSTRELARNAESWAGPRSAEKNLGTHFRVGESLLYRTELCAQSQEVLAGLWFC